MNPQVDQLEQCADDAKRAVKNASAVPEDVRKCVDELH